MFGAGNGLWPSEFDDLGDSASLATRAEMLDEGLELLAKLWSGEAVAHHGKHYQTNTQTFAPDGAHIPIWLAATWPNLKPFRRAARFDGVMAINQDFFTQLTPDEVSEIARYIKAHRQTDAPFNLCVASITSDDAQADIDRAHALEEAGANWWQDGGFPLVETLEDLRKRIRRGPPRV
ncbi:MAG: LLM class flavin-dependent oxidoreductase [Proteobacteria bacterium]|nr:LLM class flavin-dependent oxidoreductase [Pseudomonadota bacterium]